MMNNDSKKTGKSYNASADLHVVESNQTHTAIDAKLFILPPVDPSAAQSLRLAEESGTLDFWHHPEEDIYTQDDGEAI